MKRLFTILVLLMAIELNAQVQITNTSIYRTHEQMLLANEINESGEPYAEALGYNLDDLNPFVLNTPDSIAYTLGIENYEYSRYQLGTIISRSGIGLHMIWSPMVGQMAAMETDPNFDGSFTGTPNGFKEDDEMMKMIMHFSMLSNHTPPGNPWPQFAEFISGDPRLPQPIDPANYNWNDFSTLRWNRDLMDKTLNPAAMGQTLMKQYLWAQDMLGAFHNSLDNTIDADGSISPDSIGSIHFDPTNNVFYGGNNLDGFVGQVLTAEGANKTMLLINSLAYDGNTLGSVDPMTYDPASGIKYFPHKIAVTEGEVSATMPPKPLSFVVTDASSNLWDQISYLWGTINFQNMSDPNNSSDPKHLAYKAVFDGDPFPAPMAVTGMPGVFDLFMGTSMILTLNINAMHFNSTEGTLIDAANLSGGSVVQGNTITTFNAGYSLAVLKQVAQEFNGNMLGTIAKDIVTAQANFLVNNLYDGNSRFYNSYTIGSGADNSATTVETQSAAIRGLLAAYQLTGNNNYLNAAQSGYNFLISNFYVPQVKAFRTTYGSNQAVYTPLNFAALSGALREANLVLGETEAPIIYTRFFKVVGNKMQLSEEGNSGESSNDSDGDGVPFIPEQPNNLPPVFATEATLNLTGITSVEDVKSLPTDFALEQNYPNPFNPTTTIRFSLPADNFVSLKIYNLLGQEIATLVNENKIAGNYNINFNASNLSSGVYLYKLDAGKFSAVKKLTLLK
ncbi:MAG: T9SS type A sorting domain-containing protein [Ignavibacteriaceae bacterium]